VRRNAEGTTINYFTTGHRRIFRHGTKIATLYFASIKTVERRDADDMMA
jgi:hypothetical protein